MIELTGRASGRLLRVYGVGGKLLEGVRSFYENAGASVWVNHQTEHLFDQCGQANKYKYSYGKCYEICMLSKLRK